MSLGKIFISFGRAQEFEQELCGDQMLFFFPVGSDKRGKSNIASDLGTKNDAKDENTSWLVAIFTSERVFPGWFPGSLNCLHMKLLTNSCHHLLSFGQLLIILIDSYELSRVSTLINSRSCLARALSSVAPSLRPTKGGW